MRITRRWFERMTMVRPMKPKLALVVTVFKNLPGTRKQN